MEDKSLTTTQVEFSYEGGMDHELVVMGLLTKVMARSPLDDSAKARVVRWFFERFSQVQA